MNLLILGHGYSAAATLNMGRERFARVGVTTRDPARAEAFARQGLDAFVFDPASGRIDPRLRDALMRADALLVSIAPDRAGDPVLRSLPVADAPSLRWIGYYSTVGVYGDHGGGWVDEMTPCAPLSERSRWRVAAEEAWSALARPSRSVVSLRLSGIYGPGRSFIDDLRAGTARRIVKPGQVFNRIHVEDIAGATLAALDRPDLGGPLNVTDDAPAPSPDVVAYAACLLGMEPPPEIPFEQANLSPMGRSFYGENKRVSNRRLREVYGYALRYPTWREGLAALIRS
jgi:nucleoside-diphosphate-sugar epimerase